MRASIVTDSWYCQVPEYMHQIPFRLYVPFSRDIYPNMLAVSVMRGGMTWISKVSR